MKRLLIVLFLIAAAAASTLSQTLEHSDTEWYSAILQKMNEPPLSAFAQRADEGYRFIWLRTFHPPITVTVWQVGNKHFLSAKRANGMGGYPEKVSKVRVNKRRALTQAE